MKSAAVFLLLFSACAWASKHPAYTYQDGVLKSVHRVASGSSCNGNGNTTGKVSSITDTSADIDADTRTSSSCNTTFQWVYTVQVQEQTLDLTPTLTGGQTGIALATFGWGMIGHTSSLANHLPGTPVQIRQNGSSLYVKVGKKETPFHIVGAK